MPVSCFSLPHVTPTLLPLTLFPSVILFPLLASSQKSVCPSKKVIFCSSLCFDVLLQLMRGWSHKSGSGQLSELQSWVRHISYSLRDHLRALHQICLSSCLTRPHIFTPSLMRVIRVGSVHLSACLSFICSSFMFLLFLFLALLLFTIFFFPCLCLYISLPKRPFSIFFVFLPLFSLLTLLCIYHQRWIQKPTSWHCQHVRSSVSSADRLVELLNSPESQLLTYTLELFWENRGNM